MTQQSLITRLRLYEEALVEALNAFPERTDPPRFMVNHLQATIKRQEALAKIKEAS